MEYRSGRRAAEYNKPTKLSNLIYLGRRRFGQLGLEPTPDSLHCPQFQTAGHVKTVSLDPSSVVRFRNLSTSKCHWRQPLNGVVTVQICLLFDLPASQQKVDVGKSNQGLDSGGRV